MNNSKVYKSLTIYKTDLHNIGHTVYVSKNKKTIIRTDADFANIEEIILREILSLFGYKITEIHADDDDGEIDFMTNMPWKEYRELKED